MNKLLVTFLVGLFFLSFNQDSKAQTIDLDNWYFQLGIGKSVYNGDLGNSFFKVADHIHGYGVARVGRYITDKIDLNGELSIGKHANENDDASLRFRTRMTQANLSGNYNFNRWGKFNPYLSAGLGYVSFKDIDTNVSGGADASNFAIPLGGGIRYQFSDNLGIAWKSTFGLNFGDEHDGVVMDGNDSWLHHDLGLAFGFGGKNDRDGDNISDKLDACPDVPGLLEFQGCPDSDQDGIQDSEDDCPLVAGPVELAGCPDTDGDGVLNKNDDCPQVAGLSALGGCPDADGDGIKDGDDECPQVAGLSALAGCPDADGDGFTDMKDNCPEVAGPDNGCPADSDKDGVIDDEDPCPTVAGAMGGCPDSDGDGIADNLDKCPNKGGNKIDKNGCPIVVAQKIVVPSEVALAFADATAAINFNSGSATLKRSSYKSLNALADALKNHPYLNVCIGGHTDDRGDDMKNMELSQKRANAVRSYLVDKGVDAERLASTGYGETMPIADNATAAGRKQNRRVEFNACKDSEFYSRKAANPYIYPTSTGGGKGSGL